MEIPQPVDSRSSHSSSTNGWFNSGGRKFPKVEVVFFSQIVLLYIVCICSLVNLSLGNKDQLWIILLTSSLGYLMPNPSLKKRSNNNISNSNNNSSVTNDHANAAAVLPNVA